jgi:iron complex transport system permease protein
MTDYKKRNQWSLVLLSLGLIAVLITDISLGSVWISPKEFVDFVFNGTTGKESHDIIIADFRFPKAFTGLFAGAGLAIAGLIMQTLFRNPLAGPFVLGISSGASLGVAMVILASLTILGIEPGKLAVMTAGGIGAGAVMMLVLAVAARTKDNMSLLIIGLMIGSLTAAIISIMQFYSDARQLQVFMLWSYGSLTNLNWDELYIFIPVIIAGILLASIIAPTLNVFLLSENYASSMGVRVSVIRIWMIIITSLLAGVITAFCGPIAFIGIAVPHLTRILLNTSNHKILIPATALVGSIILVLCDLIATLPLSEKTLPINAVTSLIGAPIVIWLILNRRNISKTFG